MCTRGSTYVPVVSVSLHYLNQAKLVGQVQNLHYLNQPKPVGQVQSLHYLNQAKHVG